MSPSCAPNANIPVLLASATPSLETWRNVRYAAAQVRVAMPISSSPCGNGATAAAPSSLRLVPARRGSSGQGRLSETLADGIAAPAARRAKSGAG